MPKLNEIKMDKKLYKNSECEICNDFTKDVKLKKNPTTNEDVIICRECFAVFYIQEKNK